MFKTTSGITNSEGCVPPRGRISLMDREMPRSTYLEETCLDASGGLLPSLGYRGVRDIGP